MENSGIDLTIKGIGGWLILPAFGTCVAPFVFGYSVVETLSLWSAAHGDLQVIAGFDVLTATAFCAGWAWAIYLLFAESRLYPVAYCVLMGALVIVKLLEVLLLAAAEMRAELMFVGLFRSIIATAIWIPYMLASKRVKTTFVN